MKKLKLYLDTSIYNFAITDDLPQEREITLRLIDEIKSGKYEDDAFHIALASVNNLDVIVSWNFQHIVKLKTKREVNAINALLGYKAVEIYSPWEVVENV